MTKKQLTHVSLALLAVGGGLVAIMAVKDPLRVQFPALPEWFYTGCLVTGFVVTIFGILLLLLPIHWAMDTWRWLFGKSNFVAHAAKREDLEPIHLFGTEEFGEVSPLAKMKDWHKINGNIFHVMKRVRRGRLVARHTLVGYYTVIPLKQAAISFLDEDNFDGTKITDNLIVKERKGERLDRPACIYIGSIAARGSAYTRGLVMWELHGRLRAEKERGITLIYSRPVTDKGLELLKNNGFEPVKPPYNEALKHIYRCDLSSD